MVVLNIYGQIEPICISHKLKLYISNLPEEEHNEWNSYLYDEFIKVLDIDRINCTSVGLEWNKSILDIHQKSCPNSLLPDSASDDERLHEIVDNMICLYFDYEYEDMPLGGWESNPFDGRFCEKDYAELIADFFHFISETDEGCVPLWSYSSNYDREEPYYRLFFINPDTQLCIDTLKHWGKRIDSFLKGKNDYLQLDYMIRAIHDDNKYNTYHLFKLYSLCQMFLENKHEIELDNKLPAFLDERYTEEERKQISTLLRHMRNKIAHGDFIRFEKKTEEYARLVMDGNFCFDYSEYSRKNWVVIDACCLLERAVKRIIYMLFTKKSELRKIKKS